MTNLQNKTQQLHGSCLCKAIRFSIPAPVQFGVCHCEDCRKWHGAPPIGVDSTDVTLLSGSETLTWYTKSYIAERGFCNSCGSSLFYRLKSNRSKCSAYVGALDIIPEDIPLGFHSFRGHKPAFYDIVPQSK